MGKHLISFLKNKGFEIFLLSRKKATNEGIKTFLWDIEKNYIDVNCFDGVSHVIQLSGANISEKRWSAERKSEIINSRVNSTNLLFESVRDNDIRLKTFISASAVGYYGAVTAEQIFSENDLPGNDFLANTCVRWEYSAEQFVSLGIRTVMIRTGIVLINSEGALAKMTIPVKIGLGGAYGRGDQYFTWIHIDDLCGIYHKAVTDEAMVGAYNAVSPAITTNKQFVDTIRQVLNKPKLIKNIPSVLLKIAFGELAATILNGSRISSAKLLKSGFVFQFPDLQEAVVSVISNKRSN